MTGSLALPWPREALAQALAVLGPGAQVEIVPAVDSTNTELMRRAREGRTAPTGVIRQSRHSLIPAVPRRARYLSQ